MKGFLILIVLAAAGYAGWQRFGGDGVAKIVDSGGAKMVVANIDGGTVKFDLGAVAEETYMLFGADGGGDFASHGWMAGIPLQAAKRLKQRYPDFTRCDSPGAAEAEKRLDDIKVVASKRGQFGELRTIAKDFHARINAGGERLCVTVRGTWLQLASAEKGGENLTYAQMKAQFPAEAMTGFHLLPDSFQLRDCSELM